MKKIKFNCIFIFNTLLKRGKEKMSTGYNFTNIACKFNRLREKLEITNLYSKMTYTSIYTKRLSKWKKNIYHYLLIVRDLYSRNASQRLRRDEVKK